MKEGNNDNLRDKLSPEAYEVTQERKTEAPFSGKLLHNKDTGTYSCVVCGADLFVSDSKFDSGTGWPSFDQAIAGAVRSQPDSSHNMEREEVVCSHCGAHLGHVFNDGPKETTGMRYCVNSASLDFKKTIKE